MSVNFATKDLLAKLLATENITVVQENVSTASFDVKDRVLKLPLWDDMESYTYNHLVGHEVGHALWTDAEEWKSACDGRPDGFRSFLNVVEDARIEKLIQRRYPGLRRDFVKSYKKMFADGFFGTDLESINNLELIDRLNTYFKCGASFGVNFSEEEMVAVKEIEAVTTFDEVVEIAERLYGSAKEKAEQEAQERAANEESMEDEWEDAEEFDDDSGASDADDYSNDDESEQETDGNGSEETDEQDGESGEPSQSSTPSDEQADESDETPERSGAPMPQGGTGEGDSEPRSVTDNALNQNIAAEYGNSSSNVTNVSFSEVDPTPWIIPAKDLFPLLSAEDFARGREKLKEFQTNNKKAINYMVKEFEMRKRASEYARTSTAKTGVIDPVMMNNYRFSDDIFKKVAVTPEGKNHGLVMYIDWSGSMHSDMAATIDQLLNLVSFCRQVQIPFRVYAFTDNGHYWNQSHPLPDQKEIGTTAYTRDFRLLEFFNSKTMKRMQMNKAMEMLCWIKKNMYYGYGFIPGQLSLGGTPLDQAIVAAGKIHETFKKENRLDIVNTVFLTDGESHSLEYTRDIMEDGRPYTSDLSWAIQRDAVLILRDQVTKKSYRITTQERGYYGGRGIKLTNTLLKRLRDRTGSNVIGYRIVPTNKNQFTRAVVGYTGDWYKANQMHAELRKERFVTIPNSGYTGFFAIAGGKSLNTSNGSIEVAEDASKGQIRTAFKKANKGKKESRVMLSQFIDMVA